MDKLLTILTLLLVNLSADDLKNMTNKFLSILFELIKLATKAVELQVQVDALQTTIDELTVELTTKTDRLAELEPLVPELEKAQTDLGIVITVEGGEEPPVV